MYKDKKVVVVMPAYNAAKTLRKTWDEVMAQEIVDLVIVVDDASDDKTVSLARELDFIDDVIEYTDDTVQLVKEIRSHFIDVSISAYINITLGKILFRSKIPIRIAPALSRPHGTGLSAERIWQFMVKKATFYH